MKVPFDLVERSLKLAPAAKRGNRIRVVRTQLY